MTAPDNWFGTVTGLVAFDPRITPTEKAVYMALVMYRNRDDNTCWPSNDTLASHVGVSVRTVIRAVNRLEELGILIRRERYEAGRQVSSFTILTDTRGT